MRCHPDYVNLLVNLTTLAMVYLTHCCLREVRKYQRWWHNNFVVDGK